MESAIYILFATLLVLLAVVLAWILFTKPRRARNELRTPAKAQQQSAGKRPAARKQPAARKAPAPARSTSRPPAAARGKARTRPVKARVSVGTSLDLTGLGPAPEVDRVPGEKEISGEALTDLMTQSLKFSDRLHSRQKILDGLSKAPEGPKEVTDLVVSDPSLTGHILRTVNSPFYGLVKPVGSVFRAVLLLGHLEVRNIVWRTCLAEAVDESSIPPDQLDALWQHAAAASRIAYAVGKSTGLHNPDEISTAALLHDVGKLIFLDLWPERAKPFCHPGQASDHGLLIAEEDEFGIGHPRLAAELAQSWSLPEDVGSMIENHHLPSYRPPSEVSGNLRAIAAVHVADLLTHISNRYLSGAEVPSVYLPAAGWLRLLGAGDDLTRICTETVVRSLVHPNLEADRAGQPTSAA